MIYLSNYRMFLRGSNFVSVEGEIFKEDMVKLEGDLLTSF